MDLNAASFAAAIYAAATPVLRIDGLTGSSWLRRGPNRAHLGPWRALAHQVLNDEAYRSKTPCIYLVAGPDGQIRYYGKSEKGPAQGWRLSTVLDPKTGMELPEKAFNHIPCHENLTKAFEAGEGAFEVRSIRAPELAEHLRALDGELKGFAGLPPDRLIAKVIKWMGSTKVPGFAPWRHR